MLGLGNISLLAGLVAASQCDHYGQAIFPAIDAIAWAAVNAKFNNITAKLAVAPMPQRQTGKPGQNLLLPNFVSHFSQPHIEIGCAEKLKHG